MSTSWRDEPRWRSRGWRIVVAVTCLITLLGVLTPVQSTSAHAYLESSDPAMNAILPVAPSSVAMIFSEPLERSYSQARLYDREGNQIEGATSRFVADEFSMVVDIPQTLPNGTYTVIWQTLSTADGHTAAGYISFTVGTTDDVWSVTLPQLATTTGPPNWVHVTARWLSLVGLAGAVAVWPVWLFVLRPAISPAWQAGPTLTRHTRRVAVYALGIALGGSVVALLAQAASTGDLFGGALTTTLLDTRYGRVWLLRVGLFLALGLVLTGAAWWFPRRRRLLAGLGLALAALLPLPFSLISHASARIDGRETAIANDVVHTLGASLWVGGLFVLLGALIPTLTVLTPAGRKVVLSRAIPRFSTIALIAWGLLILTGTYSAWLQVGNWTALTETAYGRTLMFKLGLTVPLLMLGAINLFVITRRIKAVRSGARSNLWSRRFRAVIVTEVILVTVLLLVVGRLIGQAPAREELAQRADQIAIEFTLGDRPATLGLAPGASGLNHFRLEVGGEPLPIDTRALLRLDLPERGVEQQQLTFDRAFGNAFEWHGSEIGIPGEWTLAIILREPGLSDLVATHTLAIGSEPPRVNLPAPAPHFSHGGIGGLFLIALGVVGLVAGLQAGRTPLRRESFGLGAVGAVVGIILLSQAQIDPDLTRITSANPVPADEASIVRGAEIYRANCLACHGAELRGDGPAAASLPYPPANLTAGHALIHSDRDLFYWIENGIVGSPMPGFDDELANTDIWDVINYIQAVQNQAVEARNAPDPARCDVQPRTVEEITRLGQQVAPAAPPLTMTPPDTGTPPAVDPNLAPGGTVGRDGRGITVQIPTPIAREGSPDTSLDETSLIVPPALPTVPDGEPVSSETEAAVLSTVDQLIACSNARDSLRRLALFSDENVAQAFAGGPTQSFAALVETPPVALPRELWISVVVVSDIRLLADGRVAALVTVDNPGNHSHLPPQLVQPGRESEETAVIYFRWDGHWWLVDGLEY